MHAISSPPPRSPVAKYYECLRMARIHKGNLAYLARHGHNIERINLEMLMKIEREEHDACLLEAIGWASRQGETTQ